MGNLLECLTKSQKPDNVTIKAVLLHDLYLPHLIEE